MGVSTCSYCCWSPDTQKAAGSVVTPCAVLCSNLRHLDVTFQGRRLEVTVAVQPVMHQLLQQVQTCKLPLYDGLINLKEAVRAARMLLCIGVQAELPLNRPQTAP